MPIEDVVHLMMFNLSLHHSRSYYDLSNVIYPYIKDNWHALQLPPKVSAHKFKIPREATRLICVSLSDEEYDEQRYQG